MANFKRTIITKKGQAFIAKLEAGTAKAGFKKICTSDYDYSSLNNAQLEELTAISNIKQTIIPNQVDVVNAYNVKVRGILTNTDLISGYYIRTIALYATDPDEGEILYSITPSTLSDYIPPNNGVTSSGVIIDLLATVGNSENVSIEVNPNATVTITEFNNFKDDVNSQLNDLMNNKVDKSTSNLRTYISLSQIGITETTTLLDVIKKLPLNSMIIWDYKSTITCSDTAPDGTGYGTMIILKYSTTRIILFYQSKDGYLYNTTANNANADTTYVNEWQLLSITDSGFQDLPLASGVTNYSSYDMAKYRKIGKTVKCTGRVSGVTGTTGVLATLPIGFRPKQNCMFTTLTDGVVLVNLLVETTGVITFNCATSINSSNFISLDGIIFDI